jgi:hypothetical protein
MQDIGNADNQKTGRRMNNRSENSHLPFRRREQAMQRFRSMRSLQKFAAVHASVHNHFNQQRHLYSSDNFKLTRAAALAEWPQICSAQVPAFCGKLRLVRSRLTAPGALLGEKPGSVLGENQQRWLPAVTIYTGARSRAAPALICLLIFI